VDQDDDIMALVQGKKGWYLENKRRWTRRLRHRFARIQGSSAEVDRIKEEEISRRKTVGFSQSISFVVVIYLLVHLRFVSLASPVSLLTPSQCSELTT
jgi:hypothetical protein